MNDRLACRKLISTTKTSEVETLGKSFFVKQNVNGNITKSNTSNVV
jgi:hypothetical protein